MPPSSGTAKSFWVATVADSLAEHPPLQGDLEVDVAVVGAGIVGLSAALLLQRGGRRVAVLEALQVGRQVTGRSTAKITSQHGLIYQALEKSFGEEAAQAYGAANEAGLAQILRFIEELGIECDLERKAAYVYSRSGEQLAAIEKEAEMARRLGLPASFARECPLPFEVAGAVRFDDQAQFNPCKYLLGLAAGGTQRRRADVRRHPGALDRARRALRDHHRPGHRDGARRDRRHAHATGERRQVLRQSLSVRSSDGCGADRPGARARWHVHQHRAADPLGPHGPVGRRGLAGRGWRLLQARPCGQGREMLKDLVGFLRTEFGVDSIDYYWTNEDYESMDGMPFVGRASAATEHLYVATGFNAWGITNGTVAGMILSDLISGRTIRGPRCSMPPGSSRWPARRASSARTSGPEPSWSEATCGARAFVDEVARGRGRDREAGRQAHRRVPRRRRASCMRSPRCALIWDACWDGTRSTGPGTAHAMAPVSPWRAP